MKGDNYPAGLSRSHQSPITTCVRAITTSTLSWALASACPHSLPLISNNPHAHGLVSPWSSTRIIDKHQSSLLCSLGEFTKLHAKCMVCSKEAVYRNRNSHSSARNLVLDPERTPYFRNCDHGHHAREATHASRLQRCGGAQGFDRS